MITTIRKRVLENIKLMEQGLQELEAREAILAKNAERPWHTEAVEQARRLGSDERTQQVLQLIDQQLIVLHQNSGTASILKSLRKQIQTL